MIGNIKANWSGGTRTDERYYYVKDHLGTLRLILDEYTNVSSGKDYYAFGKTLREINNGTEQRYDYTSKELDKETGLHYFGARYYDSKIGRWLSVDPLADKYPGWSPYNYTLNNPINNYDPDGMQVRTDTEEEAKKFIEDVNSLYSGANVAYEKVTEEHSFLGLFSWRTEHYKINIQDGGNFNWGQDSYSSGLFDAISTDENVFNIKYVDSDTKVRGNRTIDDFGGSRTFSREGGANIYLQNDGSKYGDPRSVVMMHELIGHGHPAGGNDARDVNKFYKKRLNYLRDSFGAPHGGYYPTHSKIIKWNKTNLYKK